jgi:predicted transcriptional regulator
VCYARDGNTDSETEQAVTVNGSMSDASGNRDSSDETYARRVRAIEMWQGGATKRAIAHEIGVSTTTVAKYLRGQGPNGNTRSASGRAQAARSGDNNDAQLATQTEVAFTLRLAGATYNEIARTMGLDPRTVRGYIERELETRVSPKVLEYRELESARLDRYLTKLERGVEAGDVKSIDTALRISVRRARLLGLDSPVRIDMVKTEVTQEDLAIQELIREAQVRNAVTKQEIIEAQVIEAGDDGDH